jgi:hypothetical protein
MNELSRNPTLESFTEIHHIPVLVTTAHTTKENSHEVCKTSCAAKRLAEKYLATSGTMLKFVIVAIVQRLTTATLVS